MNSPDKHLHIISFAIPYPVDKGYVFDIFYKLEMLCRAGIQIHLHCFTNNETTAPDLDQYCASVQYYFRNKGHKGVTTHLPYAVSSRKNDDLLNNLLKDDYPILMEGIPCTYLLTDERFKDRKCIVRLHHIEFRHYRHLADCAYPLLKKLYYIMESRSLKKYERAIHTKALFLAVSQKDANGYKKELHCNNISVLPLFLPDWEVKSKPGTGAYCLYHGDLSLPTNERMAVWLMQSVFKYLPFPLVIAGKNPTTRLHRIALRNPHVCIIANPGKDELQDVIEKAQLHILPSQNETGQRLKLLNALINGRFCITNFGSVEGTNLLPVCHIANTPAEIKDTVRKLYNKPFTQTDIDLRKKILSREYDNEANTRHLVDFIWS
ncbi:MAG: mannosyltransferase [Filimonas sp.]|nr:mannosyltransferase [Filimonas sp.]